MKITLLSNEIALLGNLKIEFDPDKDYTKVEAIELMEQIYDKEAELSSKKNSQPDVPNQEWLLADEIGNLADKINEMIPN